MKIVQVNQKNMQSTMAAWEIAGRDNAQIVLLSVILPVSRATEPFKSAIRLQLEEEGYGFILP